jgi:hypothetical protein
MSCCTALHCVLIIGNITTTTHHRTDDHFCLVCLAPAMPEHPAGKTAEGLLHQAPLWPFNR